MKTGSAHGNYRYVPLRYCVVCASVIQRGDLSPWDYQRYVTCSPACGHEKRSRDAKDWTLIEARFWGHVQKTTNDACWPWQKVQATYYKTPRTGYGVFRAYGRNWLAHNLAWAFTNGSVPAGLFVLHTCDNPPCCNPHHLWLGTKRDNSQDALQKGRLVLPHMIGKGRWPSQREALRNL